MKEISIVIIVMGLSFVSAVAQESCLDPDRLASLDAGWEKALLESNVNRLGSLLAEDFVWIHNHTSGIDSKASLIKRASDPDVGATGNPRSRNSFDVNVIILDSTGVVTGLTVVDRGASPTTYSFMRTYVKVGGTCLLLANHTMVIPDDK